MLENDKLWISLSAALLTSTSLVAGAAPVAHAGQATVVVGEESGLAAAAQAKSVQLAAGRAGEGGERGQGGEGGEGGEAGEGGERGAAADPARSDSAYLTQLGLIRGHLFVGAELYRQGHAEHAATHMKHPEDELYADLRPALEKRSAPGFETELEMLAARVEKKAPAAEVEAAYAALTAAIAKAENAAPKPSAHEIGEIIHNLVRVAAKEYEVAVDGGKIVEPHEYQDALGFVHVAEDWVKKLQAAGADPVIVDDMRQQLAKIMPAWPSVVPPDKALMEPTAIHGAAARIEIAALGLQK